MKRKAIVITVFAVVMALFFVTASTAYAAGTVSSASGLNMRSGPGTDYAAVVTIPNGASVTIIEEGVKASDGSIWYKVSYGGMTGFVHSSYISKGTSGGGGGGSAQVPSDFKTKMQNAGFPESYYAGLYQIYQNHPNWNFRAVKTGLDWETAVDKESALGVSLVENSLSDVLKSVAKGAYSLSGDSYISFDSGNWVAASEETVAYYMDPRNFLNSTDIFQFMSSRFDSSTQTLAAVQQVVAGTFLEGNAPGTSESYAQIIYDAGKNLGVNPMIIASMILSEQGTNGTGASISGDVKGYEGYYNFMNINAYAGGGKDAVANGLEYAKKQGWDTPEKSINGGVSIYASNYVNSNKYTLYFQRFNVLNGIASVGTGQYMTSIYGAQVEGAKLAGGYSSYGDKSLTFDIPVYSNMPSSACPKPSGSGNNVNYLKTLTVEDGKLASDFDPYTYTYEAVVEDGTKKTNVKATAYKDAKVSGAGSIVLNKSGAKRADIQVTSSSGKTRDYSLTVVTESFDGSLTADTERFAGSTRFETAVKVADELKKKLGVSKFSNIVVAYSDGFADALSATALAADRDAPILVVNENNKSYVKSYIDQNLKADGTVYLIGGTGVISTSFEKSLGDYNVVRLAGENRYETNLEVLEELGISSSDEIMVASGTEYADALTASATGNPVLLTGNSLTSAQVGFLKGLGGKNTCYVLGGTAAVSDTVMNQVSTSAGGKVTRIYGDTRYETGKAVAEKFFADADTVFVASGDDFPDGLTGGVLANACDSPIMLVNKYNTETAADFVYTNVVQTVTAIGGTAVISDAMLNAVI